MRGLHVFNDVKNVRESQIKKISTFLVESMDMLGLTITVIGFKHIYGYCNALDVLYIFR